MEHPFLWPGRHATAYHINNGVIKVLQGWPKDGPAEIERSHQHCKREEETYEILGHHDRILKCLFINSPLHDFLILEFCANGTLAEFSRKTTQRPTQVYKWALQMAEGLAYIHSRGVHHSDLRLDQWLVDADGNARLGDFNGSGHAGDAAQGIEPALWAEILGKTRRRWEKRAHGSTARRVARKAATPKISTASNKKVPPSMTSQLSRSLKTASRPSQRFQHHVELLWAHDKTLPGHCEILVRFLVDPNLRVSSTAFKQCSLLPKE